MSQPSCDVLLVTVTKVETEAMLAVAGPGMKAVHFGEKITCTDLGWPGNTRVGIPRSAYKRLALRAF